MADAPLVGIGLPTLNGERFIAEALESLLAQDHRELEIVVADNASTDRTPEIVREFARRDSRIRHERVEALLSAPANFNRVFASTRGPYFMWAADDDLWDPSYVRRCVAALEADPAAVMASTGVRFIDPTGQPIEADHRQYDNPDLSSRSVVRRVRTLIRRRGWYQVYGLSRRDALSRTRLFQDAYGADVVLVTELAMLGPIVLVPEPLFSYRRQPGQTEAARAARQGGIEDEGSVLTARMTHLQESLSDAVRQSSLPRSTKLRLRAEILRAAYVDDTPMRRRARPEADVRVAGAARAHDLGGIAKFGLIAGVARLAALGDLWRRALARLQRYGRGVRRRLR